MADTIPKLLTLAAVAEALSVSPHTIRMWVRNGRLRPVRYAAGCSFPRTQWRNSLRPVCVSRTATKGDTGRDRDRSLPLYRALATRGRSGTKCK